MQLPPCISLDTTVYSLGLALTCVYLLLGLGGVVWFVLSYTEDGLMEVEGRHLYLVHMDTMLGSLAKMAVILVVTFLGLLTCLLLILGVKRQQRLFLLPWQLYHGAIVLLCLAVGLYHALH